MRKTSTFRAHIGLPAGVERENFKIDSRSLFGVGPAGIMHVERNVRLRHVCIRLTYSRNTSMSVVVGWLQRELRRHINSPGVINL